MSTNSKEKENIDSKADRYGSYVLKITTPKKKKKNKKSSAKRRKINEEKQSNFNGFQLKTDETVRT